MAKHGEGGHGGGHKESHGGGHGGGGGTSELGELFSLATLKEIFLEPLSSKEKKAAILQTLLWILGAGYWAATIEGIAVAEGIDKIEKEMGLGGGEKKSGHGGGHELGGHGGEKKGGKGGGHH